MSMEEIPTQEAPAEPPVTELTAEQKAFAADVVKRVRSESKKLGVATRIADLDASSHGLDAGQVKAALDDVQERNRDIRYFMLFNAATFLFSDKYVDATLAEREARAGDMRAAIARMVREAAEGGAPTSIESLRAISQDLTAEELEARLAELAADPDTADIKRLVAFTGAEYFYSTKTMTEEQAEKAARSEELQIKIVVEIRGDSKYLAKLTRIDGLTSLAPDVQPGELESELEAIQKQPIFEDIHVLRSKDGTLYAASALSMTQEYGAILLRIEENDPCYTIVETVREESRVYPRPTNIELFKYALFNMDRSRLDEYVERVLAENEDIKRFVGKKGSIYLYSDTYVTEDQAEWYDRRQHSES